MYKNTAKKKNKKKKKTGGDTVQHVLTPQRLDHDSREPDQLARYKTTHDKDGHLHKDCHPHKD